MDSQTSSDYRSRNCLEKSALKNSLRHVDKTSAKNERSHNSWSLEEFPDKMSAMLCGIIALILLFLDRVLIVQRPDMAINKRQQGNGGVISRQFEYDLPLLNDGNDSTKLHGLPLVCLCSRDCGQKCGK